MTPRRSLLLVALVVAAVAGCHTAPLATPTSAGGPPRFLAAIPADTPYVVAMLEPMPASYLDRMVAAFAGLSATYDAMLAAVADSTAKRFVRAVLNELRPAPSEASVVRVLGVRRDARFALYGVGVLPVLRLELADDAALRATIERAARASGAALPTRTIEGRTYWRFVVDDLAIIAAIADGQLILAGGPAALVDLAAATILGTSPPARSMADGGPLAAVAAAYGFGRVFIGYGDLRAFLANPTVGLGLASALGPNAAPCTRELAATAARVPRFVFGYSRFDDARIDGRFVLETDAAIAARLRELVVEMTGFGADRVRPLFAVGGGFDLAKGRALLGDAFREAGRIAGACGKHGTATEYAELAAKVTGPLPPGIEGLRGGLVSLLSLALGPDGKPTQAEGFAIAATQDGPAMLAIMQQAIPFLAIIQVPTDGALHQVMPAGAVPGVSGIHAAVRPDALVAAVGDAGRAAAERAVAGRGPAPLLYFDYDYKRFMALVNSMNNGRTAANDAITAAAGEAIGQASFALRPSERGLEIKIDMELLPDRSAAAAR